MSPDPVVQLCPAGTDEQRWVDAAPWARLPQPDLTAIRRFVVVAPHPDDEVLGAGGLLQLRRPRVVVGVTGGEASHPDSDVLSPSAMAVRRRAERRAALHRLGAASVPLHRLGHADGDVDPDLLRSQLRSLLRPGDACVVTARFDGHPDHEACGRAAVAAARDAGATVWEYPVWTWHRTTPEDPEVPWHRARVLPLSSAQQDAKAHALQAFRSQIAPLHPDEPTVILPPEVLAHFLRPQEVYFLADGEPGRRA